MSLDLIFSYPSNILFFIIISFCKFHEVHKYKGIVKLTSTLSENINKVRGSPREVRLPDNSITSTFITKWRLDDNKVAWQDKIVDDHTTHIYIIKYHNHSLNNKTFRFRDDVNLVCCCSPHNKSQLSARL